MPRFCSECGTVWKPVPGPGGRHERCSHCHIVRYLDPKLAVAVIIAETNCVLLGRRVADPGRGLWALPGGFVDRGEMVEHAAIREAREELGVDIALKELVGIFSWTGEPVVLAIYRARIVHGHLVPGDDVDAAQFFPLAGLPSLAFVHDAMIIARGLVRRDELTNMTQ